MTTVNHVEILKELGEGIVLRRSTPDDAEALSAFNGCIHSDYPGEIDTRVIDWTHDLLLRPHPTFSPDDFTIVEDTNTGKIISSMNLIPQIWSYEDVLFKVGRPELVGTDPEYRNRGLVRLQFDVIHQWCQERGYAVQAITGIPYYYRLFGYEMALALGGGRTGSISIVPQLKEGESEPYQICPAQGEDVPFMAGLYDVNRARYLVSAVWNEDLFRYELEGKSPNNVNRFDLRMIETAEGKPVGYLAHVINRWGAMMPVNFYELIPGLSWAAVTPSVLRYLKATGQERHPEHGNDVFTTIGFWLGEDHPVYHVLLDKLPNVRHPYAFYMRVPDLPAFIRHIAPVLERRLAASPFSGHTGELKLTFYRDGLRLVFEAGRLVLADTYRPEPVGHVGDAAFPGLTFLQLLFGYRSLADLKYAFADCWTSSPETQALLESLFPRKPSDVWPVA